MNNIDAIILKNLSDSYKILAEDEELRFIIINKITNEIAKKYQIYEVDHTHKVIYLELKESDPKILITTSDDLELPLYAAKNLNEAAEFMNITATHLYRAYRNAGKPQRLKYNNFILYFLTI